MTTASEVMIYSIQWFVLEGPATAVLNIVWDRVLSDANMANMDSIKSPSKWHWIGAFFARGRRRFFWGESLSCLAKISPSEVCINWLTTYLYLAFVEGVMKLQHITFFLGGSKQHGGYFMTPLV